MSACARFERMRLNTRKRNDKAPKKQRKKPLWRRAAVIALSALSLLLVLACLAVSYGEASRQTGGALSEPPAWAGEAVTEINGNEPFFTQEEMEGTEGVSYSALDRLGRCGVCLGRLGPETLPRDKRGPIGDVKPTGWHTVRYDELIEDRYLYTRCHLIGYQLAGANADERNLITGTRYLNISGMLPYENRVYAYISETGNHVLYRVSPVFVGEDLLASGVLMEARSLEDGGRGLSFCIYAHNVQPGIVIDYRSGESRRAGDEPASGTGAQPPASGQPRYVLNTNTLRFHRPDCPAVGEIKPQNRQDFYGSRDEAVARGYTPCGRCKP